MVAVTVDAMSVDCSGFHHQNKRNFARTVCLVALFLHILLHFSAISTDNFLQELLCFYILIYLPVFAWTGWETILCIFETASIDPTSCG